MLRAPDLTLDDWFFMVTSQMPFAARVLERVNASLKVAHRVPG
jgi:hypothetical protein